MRVSAVVDAALVISIAVTLAVAAFFYWLATRDLRRRIKDVQVTLSHVLRIMHAQGWCDLPENERGAAVPVDEDGTFSWIHIGDSTYNKMRPAPGLRNRWRRLKDAVRPTRRL